MATRKIRLTLSGTQLDGVGPLIDIDFNSENLDVDVDVTAVTGTDTLVKEYTVDVAPGIYNLDISYKNDGNSDQDRNLAIERVEIANDGSTYSNYYLTSMNVNAAISVPVSGYVRDLVNGVGVPNPDFDAGAVRTDSVTENNYEIFSDPGANAKYLYSYIDPASVVATMYTNGIGSIQIVFE